MGARSPGLRDRRAPPAARVDTRRAAAAVEKAVLAVVARIPRGKVTTYGEVATRAGQPRRARLVGRVLSRLPPGSRLPWHRVVAAGGRIAFPAGAPARIEQVERLRREGVDACTGRVDLHRHLWSGPPVDIDRWLWRVGDEN